jgi:hypothetical protein
MQNWQLLFQAKELGPMTRDVSRQILVPQTQSADTGYQMTPLKIPHRSASFGKKVKYLQVLFMWVQKHNRTTRFSSLRYLSKLLDGIQSPTTHVKKKKKKKQKQWEASLCAREKKRQQREHQSEKLR